MSRLRQKKLTLYRKQKGLCFWCQKPMVLCEPGQTISPVPPNLCTVDHLESRWHPDRGRAGDNRLVAACSLCNGRRDREQLRLIPKELLKLAARGMKPAKIAREHADKLRPLFPILSGHPPPKPPVFTFEPKRSKKSKAERRKLRAQRRLRDFQRFPPWPLRAPLAELAALAKIQHESHGTAEQRNESAAGPLQYISE